MPDLILLLLQVHVSISSDNSDIGIVRCNARHEYQILHENILSAHSLKVGRTASSFKKNVLR